jgi:hypothetical protein
MGNHINQRSLALIEESVCGTRNKLRCDCVRLEDFSVDERSYKTEAGFAKQDTGTTV